MDGMAGLLSMALGQTLSLMGRRWCGLQSVPGKGEQASWCSSVTG